MTSRGRQEQVAVPRVRVPGEEEPPPDEVLAALAASLRRELADCPGAVRSAAGATGVSGELGAAPRGPQLVRVPRPGTGRMRAVALFPGEGPEDGPDLGVARAIGVTVEELAFL